MACAKDCIRNRYRKVKAPVGSVCNNVQSTFTGALSANPVNNYYPKASAQIMGKFGIIFFSSGSDMC